MLIFTLFAIALTLEDEDTTTSPCPDGWIDGSFVDMGREQQYLGGYWLYSLWHDCGGCILPHHLALNSEAMSWEDAYQFCYQNHSRLVEVRSHLQLEFLNLVIGKYRDMMLSSLNKRHQNRMFSWRRPVYILGRRLWPHSRRSLAMDLTGRHVSNV